MSTPAIHSHYCRTTVDSAPALSLGVVPNSLKDGLHIRLSHHATLLSEALPQHKEKAPKKETHFSHPKPLSQRTNEDGQCMQSQSTHKPHRDN